MIKWRGKSVNDLSKSELQYALQDAVEALTLNRKSVNEDSLYRGLMLGFLAGAVLAGTAFGVGSTLLT